MDAVGRAAGHDTMTRATAVLRRRHREATAHVSPSGQSDSSRVRVLAIGLREMRRTIPELAERSSELLSVGVSASPASLLSNHRANVALRERGLRMVSLFDYESAHVEARQLLSTLTGSPYHFCRGDVQMKILDRRTVLLEGPVFGGERSLIAVTDPQVVAAAFAYWNSVWPTAVSATAAHRGDEPHGLSERQREVAGLMTADLTDEAIAQLLGVCVRTVRTEIAAIMRLLKVRTRFSAGVHLGRLGIVAPVERGTARG
jgi:DNA-binding CsgD family transcriptional regulator